MDAVAAKQFLISQVLHEADSSHVQLSEVERKMLYFTESYPSLPDLQAVNAEFERECDADEYEDKVAKLLRNARARTSQSTPSEDQHWKEAIDALRKEDHYIMVMVGLAFGYGSASNTQHRFRDFLIYIVVGIAVVLTLLWWSFKH